MLFATAVEMDSPRKVRMRIYLIEPFFEQQRVGAQIDEFFAAENSTDNFPNIAVQQRLAAGKNNDRGAAFVYGV